MLALPFAALLKIPLKIRSSLRPLKCYKALASTVLLAALLLGAGCSGKKAPEPPLTRPALLLDIYASIAKGDHKGAFNKILRLREIEKNSVFLTELESIERNNMYLVEARRLLSDGDIAGAADLLDGAIKRHGQHDELIDARASISSLNEISKLIDEINNPKSSASLKNSSERLSELAKTFKPAAPFAAYAKEKAARIPELERFEETLRLFDLCADADILGRSGTSETLAIYAQIAIEAPGHPVLRNHLSKIASAPGVHIKTKK